MLEFPEQRRRAVVGLKSDSSYADVYHAPLFLVLFIISLQRFTLTMMAMEELLD